MRIVMAMLLSFSLTGVAGEVVENGDVRQGVEDGLQAWYEPDNEWITLDEFWNRYSAGVSGKVWPSSAAYPPYDDVNEGDVFLVKLRNSTCLMEFFHSRWRRANDVRRWDDAFNAYAACPYVFK